MSKPLGIRLNNPGNLRDAGIDWQGKVGSESGFVKFESMYYGLRAMALDLAHKIMKRKLNTISKIIHVYAPVEDHNDTNVYIQRVSKAVGIGPDDQITSFVKTGPKLMWAMIQVEQGVNEAKKYITKEDVMKALKSVVTPGGGDSKDAAGSGGSIKYILIGLAGITGLYLATR
jgi:hypothetical protein